MPGGLHPPPCSFHLHNNLNVHVVIPVLPVGTEAQAPHLASSGVGTGVVLVTPKRRASSGFGGGQWMLTGTGLPAEDSHPWRAGLQEHTVAGEVRVQTGSPPTTMDPTVVRLRWVSQQFLVYNIPRK